MEARQHKRRKLDDGSESEGGPTPPAPDRVAIGHHVSGTSIDGYAVVHQGDNHYYGGENARNANTVDADRQERYNVLVESLTFPRMDARLRNVEAALPSTCKWLLHHSQFLAWNATDRVQEHNGFLWIKGKPGSGKSTLMKHTLAWFKRRHKGWLTPSYFFNARATGALEKSSLGLYRSLVHQALLAAPTFERLFMDKFNSKLRGGTVEDWSESELQDFLTDIIQQPDRPPICTFIDALDEGKEDDIRSMVSYLETLAMVAPVHGPPLRICLSSRHYPHISIEKGLSLVVEDEAAHANDFRIYVYHKVTGNDSEQINNLREEICSKSLGIFLWVVLVVRILNKVSDHGLGLDAMRTRLHEIPVGLDGLFAEILAKNPDEMNNCVAVLQWMLFSMRSLTPAELFLAVCYTCGKPGMNMASVNRMSNDASTVHKFILNCSRGLVEITKVEPLVVQFIHGSVRDFLIDAGDLARIEPTLSSSVEGLSSNTLKQTCLRYINSCPMWRMGQFTNARVTLDVTLGITLDELQGAHQLIEYSTAHLFAHAAAAQNNDIPQREFLKSILANEDESYSRWVKARNLFQKFKARMYTTHVSLLYVVVEQRLKSLIEVLCDGLVDVNVKGERYGSALQAAAVLGSEAIVKQLIRNGANVHAEGGEHGHAILAAIVGKQYAVADMLRTKGKNLRQIYSAERS
ncbi:hypothetical protein PMZ80_006359 [Knufia obscura]|uniref:Nephrocystin 3-like N-terminal domain-containing protein n=2 Tax=Knufia TaxID=430999 RepID=A0AAN8I8X1_9EURO|nr:hypothetical protein PMZ80_006359 [Knufia obscura]KAK5953495.1 hypothetical protein OHC33_005439 [Knufia fluminis]